MNRLRGHAFQNFCFVFLGRLLPFFVIFHPTATLLLVLSFLALLSTAESSRDLRGEGYMLV